MDDRLRSTGETRLANLKHAPRAFTPSPPASSLASSSIHQEFSLGQLRSAAYTGANLNILVAHTTALEAKYSSGS